MWWSSSYRNSWLLWIHSKLWAHGRPIHVGLTIQWWRHLVWALDIHFLWAAKLPSYYVYRNIYFTSVFFKWYSFRQEKKQGLELLSLFFPCSHSVPLSVSIYRNNKILPNFSQPLKRKWHCCSLNTSNAYLTSKVVFSQSVNKSCQYMDRRQLCRTFYS